MKKIPTSFLDRKGKGAKPHPLPWPFARPLFFHSTLLFVSLLSKQTATRACVCVSVSVCDCGNPVFFHFVILIATSERKQNKQGTTAAEATHFRRCPCDQQHKQQTGPHGWQTKTNCHAFSVAWALLLVLDICRTAHDWQHHRLTIRARARRRPHHGGHALGGGKRSV